MKRISGRTSRPLSRRLLHRRDKLSAQSALLNHVFAVRYREGVEGRRIAEALSAAGSTRPLTSHRMILVDLGSGEWSGIEKSLEDLVGPEHVEFVTPVLWDEKSETKQILTDEITVRFNAVPSLHTLRELQKRFGVTVARRNEFVPRQVIMRVTNPNGLRTLNVAKQLDRVGEVEFATPNFLTELRK